MIIADTLNLEITNGKIVYDGVVIHSIAVESDANRTISFSPKHRQSFMSGNLMVSDEKGLIYVPLDEVNTVSEYIVLRSDGSLSKMPTLSYEAYIEALRKFRAQKMAEIKTDMFAK